MKARTALLAAAATVALSACSGLDTTQDYGLDSGPLTAMRAGIWIDPNGCDHWIIDDGVEGYMSPRVEPDGTPVCREEFDVNTIDFERRTVGEN